MYKLFIVDGNPRDGGEVAGMLDWNAMGLQVAGIFANGLEALQEAERSRPDVVLTDVRMPDMDGFELGRSMQERYPGVKLIFMSGGDAFASAGAAPRPEAERFVQKPVRRAELREAIAKAAEKLERERNAARERDEWREHIKRSLPERQDRFVRDLLLGTLDGTGGEPLRKWMELLEIGLPADGRYRVMLLRTAAGGSGEADIPDDFRIMRHMEAGLAARPQPPGVYARLVPMSERRLALIVGCDSGIREGERPLDWVLQAEERMDESLQHALSIGISGQGRLDDLPKLYAQAARALAGNVYSDRTPRVLFYEEAVEFGDVASGVASDPDGWLQDMRELLFSEKAPDVQPHIDRYLNGFETAATDGGAKTLLLQLSGALQRMYVEAGVSASGLLILFLSLWNKLEAAPGQTDVRPAIWQMFALARRQLVDERRPYYDQVAKDIKRIVMKRYMEPITVRQIADELQLSLRHANDVFQNKTGRKLFDYLTEYRMEMAKSLLREAGGDIGSVARQVGFADESHFCLVFKKYAGLTPSAYRSRSETAES
ncbi:helix-turn-helix domain-containing protein [Paenibacillus sp. GYB003]|uniref:helix-turn-helix domain-containing protein n=1 Tax=Paenibacillus sp. GYB003 TaxID=2994392 RepID=UPI002F962168